MKDQKRLDERIEKTHAVKFESNIQQNDVEKTDAFFPDYSMLEHPRIPTPSPPPAPPVLTVNQPTPNAVVGLNKSFLVAGTVTDRGGTEPITIESVTVQIDGGPLIDAPLKIIPDKTLWKVSFQASAPITGGSDPHTVTVVATNDQQLRATKTITVFAGSVFQVDAPAFLLDARTLSSITANDTQVLKINGEVQRQLVSLSDTLASAGKVLIGPNLIVQPLSASEYLVRIGFWIENPGFPVVPSSADFPLPRLTDAAAAMAFRRNDSRQGWQVTGN